MGDKENKENGSWRKWERKLKKMGDKIKKTGDKENNENVMGN